jgi:hypothetical protein
MEITRQYANSNDPWWADTIVVSQNILDIFNPNELARFRESLQRLGIALEIDHSGTLNRITPERQNRGPWFT